MNQSNNAANDTVRDQKMIGKNEQKADTFDALPAQMRNDLEQMADNVAMIPAPTVNKWINSLMVTKQEIMMLLLSVAAAYARSPISHFQVGAVAMGQPVAGVPDNLGNLYLGASYEFPGLPLSFVVHAEQSAINNAWLHGETGLQFLSITAAPCGYCRQFLYEISTAQEGFTILLPNPYTAPAYSENKVTTLLPYAFGPQNLGKKGRLMQSQQQHLEYHDKSPLVQQTLEAANQSYAPYSKNYAAVSLRVKDGTVVAGRYAENAAYNPSLSPLQSAVSQLNLLQPLQRKLEISAALLLENMSIASQYSVTRDVLSVIAPDVTLQHIVVQQ